MDKLIRHQSDQIGRFLKVLFSNFLWKIAQFFVDFLATFLSKNWWGCIWATFKKFGQLFIFNIWSEKATIVKLIPYFKGVEIDKRTAAIEKVRF